MMTMSNDMNVYDKFEKAALLLIEVNAEGRNKFSDYYSNLGGARFLYQFGITRIDCGRSVGKSRFIKTHAKSNDLIICQSASASDYYTRHESPTKAKVCSVAEAPFFKSLQKFTGMRVSTVWIDELTMSVTGRDYDLDERLRILCQELQRFQVENVVIFGQ